MKKILVSILSVLMVLALAAPVSAENVWSNGNNSYESFSSALSACGDADCEITLTSSTKESITVDGGKNVTLNIPSGVTLTNTDAQHTILVSIGSELTIIGGGTIDNVSNGRAPIFNNGTCNIQSANIVRSAEASDSETSSGGNSYYNILNHGIMTIGTKDGKDEDLKITSKGSFSSLVANGYFSFSSDNPTNGYVEGTNHENPTLTINSGTFSGGINTVKNDDNGILTVNGGKYANVTQAAIQNHGSTTINDGYFSIDGKVDSGEDTFVVDNCGCDPVHDLGELKITGGTFIGSDYAIFDRSTQSPKIMISNITLDTDGYAIAFNSTSNATIDISNSNVSGKVSATDTQLNIQSGTYSFDPSKYVDNTVPQASLSSNGSTTYAVSDGFIRSLSKQSKSGDKIIITNGDVELTGIPQGVSIKNAGTGKVTVNGIEVAANGGEITTPVTPEKPSRPTYRPSSPSKDLPSNTKECQKEFGDEYIWSDEYDACVIKFMIVDTSTR